MEGEGGVSLASRSLSPMKVYPGTNYTKGGGEIFGEGRNLLLLPEIEPRFLGHPVLNLVTVPTELSWLSRTLNVWYYLLSNCYSKGSELDNERFLAEVLKSVCFLHRFLVVLYVSISSLLLLLLLLLLPFCFVCAWY
jgi:hypothetical protein